MLPGKPPLGGAILSHDFVEAAFMRRAGWRVYLASDLDGSYEEMPATLLGFAARDRRWCQGNLQHGKLLFSPGLHFISRVHIWIGMMGYLASPLWLLMLGLTTAQGIREALVPHSYFDQHRSLFPTWPVAIGGPALSLFFIILGFLLLPKALSVILELRRSQRLAQFGGPFKLIASASLELLLSTLLAPNLALLQSRFVVSILMGSTAKWEAQDRGDTGTPWSEAVHRHWPATVLGIGWTLLLACTAPKLLAWFSPVLVGYLLAIPLSVWTSKATAGLWAKERGLFLIPEESNPPQLIQDLQSEFANNANRPWCEPVDPVSRVLRDSDVRELHLGMLSEEAEPEDALKRHQREGLILKYQHYGPQALSAPEKRELLLHADAIEALSPARPEALQALSE